jgi:protein-tyrosine phosphatase
VSAPPPRDPGRYRIGVVCLGNICRSPMADVVLQERIADAGLEDRVEVASCGTGGWHVGDPMDHRAAATLRDAGYDPSRHRAHQYDATWRSSYDLLLAMDEQNLADVGGRDGDVDRGRVRLFRDFDPAQRGAEVPDPYYGGPAGFEEVLRMVERTATQVVAEVERELAQP